MGITLLGLMGGYNCPVHIPGSMVFVILVVLILAYTRLRDEFRGDLFKLREEFGGRMSRLRDELRDEFRGEISKLREEFRSEMKHSG